MDADASASFVPLRRCCCRLQCRLPAVDSALQGVASQLAVAVPELGWSVCEALFMPLLLKLKVPPVLLTSCWLFSPILGFLAQPFVGSLCDRYGARRLVLILTAAAATGLMLTPMSAEMGGDLAMAVVIIGYGLTDMSHDLLYTVSRVQMNDLLEADLAEQKCAVAASLGKLTSIILATSVSVVVALRSVAGIIWIAFFAQLLSGRSSPHESQEAPARCCSCFAGLRRAPSGFWLMWLMSCAGWASNCATSFYVTSIWAEQSGAEPGSQAFDDEVRQATLLLLCAAVWHLAVGNYLPSIISLLGGELQSMVFSLLGFSLAQMAFGLLPRSAAAFMMVAVIPLCDQIAMNAPLAWLERTDFDQDLRGTISGWISTSLSVGQIMNALCVGPLVAATGMGLVVAFYAAAAVNLAVVTAAVMIQLSQRIKSRGRTVAFESHSSPLGTAGADIGVP